MIASRFPTTGLEKLGGRVRPVLCFVLLFSWSAFAQAQSRFDGTWKIDLAESQSSTKIYAYLL